MSEISKQDDAGFTTINPAKDMFEGLNITRVNFHQSVDVPTKGATTSLYAKTGVGLGRSATTNVIMKYNKDGLFCVYQGHAFVVPLANIIVAYIG